MEVAGWWALWAMGQLTLSYPQNRPRFTPWLWSVEGQSGAVIAGGRINDPATCSLLTDTSLPARLLTLRSTSKLPLLPRFPVLR